MSQGLRCLHGHLPRGPAGSEGLLESPPSAWKLADCAACGPCRAARWAGARTTVGWLWRDCRTMLNGRCTCHQHAATGSTDLSRILPGWWRWGPLQLAAARAPRRHAVRWLPGAAPCCRPAAVQPLQRMRQKQREYIAAQGYAWGSCVTTEGHDVRFGSTRTFAIYLAPVLPIFGPPVARSIV
jgi:hypothetical protein